MRAVVALVLIANTGMAQVPLTESPQALRCTVALTLSGTMKFDRGRRTDEVPVTATAKHEYVQHGLVRKYTEATSARNSVIEKSEVALPEAHRVVVYTDGQPASPGGSLTRDEYSLVAEHFNVTAVSGLLPNRNVKTAESWAVNDDTAAALCLLDGVISQSLSVKLETVENGKAILVVSGGVIGLEAGAKVTSRISARGEFDVKSSVLTTLTWEQNDEREQGPVSPAMTTKVNVTITRVSSSDTLTAPKVDPAHRSLIYRDAEKKFEVRHDRDWHVITATENHLVLRLVRKNELIAQATITPWKKKDENAIKDFQAAILKQPGWVPGTQLGIDQGNPFIIVSEGKQDGLDVIETFALAAATDGRQAVLACVVRPELRAKLGDAATKLATGLTFPPAKIPLP